MMKNKRIFQVPIYNWKKYLLLLIGLYGLCTIAIWKKYQYNPTSMVNFGKEFAILNPQYTPKGAIVMLGKEGDLGAGYDGQIFYYFSRPLSQLNLNWPKGFDESYRAPRIGYPFLISWFGFWGEYGAIFGMYFWNLVLLFLSFLALREILGSGHRKWAILYLVSPFALGSYSVLVSDSVMVSLVVLAYYFFLKEKFIPFIFIGGLAILTKEPALFFFFPLGLYSLWKKNYKQSLAILSTLVFMVAWQMYLKNTFPHWKAGRLTDFIQPLDGISFYLKEILSFSGSGKDFIRLLGRFPLLVLFSLGTALVFFGDFKKGFVFRLAMALTMFMIGVADHYHFWSVYENISRMFTISIPIVILWKKEDPSLPAEPYALVTFLVTILFLIKLFFITNPLPYEIWMGG